MVVAKRDPRVLVAPHYAQERRTTRRPQHKFNLRFKPYEIQPMLLAPVLPGETDPDDVAVANLDGPAQGRIEEYRLVVPVQFLLCAASRSSCGGSHDAGCDAS